MIEQMSRRDFLKAAGGLFLTGLGIRIGLDRVLAPLELDQRRQTFRRLQNETNTREGKDTLRSWLLFQGAQGYAASRGDWITAEAQQRYLFGDGAAWNITPVLKRHLLSRNGPFNGAIRDSDHAFTLFYQNIIQQSVNNAKKIEGSFDAGLPPAVMKRNLEKQRPFDVRFQGIADGGEVSRDVLSTLGKFTVYNEGNIGRIHPVDTKEKRGWYLDQYGGTARLYDYHDWNRSEPELLGGRITGADIVYGVLTPLGADDPPGMAKALFGEHGLENLEAAKIEIRGSDAIRLEKHGLAKPFPIYTEPHELRAQNRWYVPSYFFSNEPIFSP